MVYLTGGVNAGYGLCFCSFVADCPAACLTYCPSCLHAAVWWVCLRDPIARPASASRYRRWRLDTTCLFGVASIQARRFFALPRRALGNTHLRAAVDVTCTVRRRTCRARREPRISLAFTDGTLSAASLPPLYAVCAVLLERWADVAAPVQYTCFFAVTAFG